MLLTSFESYWGRAWQEGHTGGRIHTRLLALPQLVGLPFTSGDLPYLCQQPATHVVPLFYSDDPHALLLGYAARCSIRWGLTYAH